MTEQAKEVIKKYLDQIESNQFDEFLAEAYQKGVYEEVVSIMEDSEVEMKKSIMYSRKFTIVPINKPSYLNEVDFLAWLVKFQKTISAIGLQETELDEHTIQFSNEEAKTSYSGLSVEELKKLIRDTWGKDSRVEEILEGIRNRGDFEKEKDELYQELCRVYESKRNLPNPEQILFDKIKELKFEADVLGEYIHAEKKIVLYTKNIEKAALKNGNTNKQEMEVVFIHELFHAYHYANDKGELVNRRDYTAEVVMESLASAFEWYYITEHGLQGAKKLRSSWERHSVKQYPYSGAENLVVEKYYPSTIYLKKAEFCNIFNISLNDVDDAMRKLLSSKDFYAIKNAASVIYKTKPTTISKKSGKSRGTLVMASIYHENVGKIAKREIPQVLNAKPYLVSDLLDENYCRKVFGTQKAVLSTVQVGYKSGTYYYTNTISVNGKDYYLFKHWREEHRQPLLDWIDANK